MVIGVSVVNALANKNMSYAEIIVANTIVVGAIAVLESLGGLINEISKNIIYEKIENIKPENYNLLKADLEERTGLTINRVSINNVDFLKDTARVTIYYNANKKEDYE